MQWFLTQQKKPCTFNPSNFLLNQKVTKNQDKTQLPPALSNRKSHGNVGQNETSKRGYKFY
jgi:hypothetical protein